MDDTAKQNCNGKPSQECRDALRPHMQSAGVSAHAKRFILVTAATFGYFLEVVVVELLAAFILYEITKPGIPKEMHIDREGLMNFDSMKDAQTFAVVAGPSAAPSTVTYKPPTTTTAAYVFLPISVQFTKDTVGQS
jgi:hypothetical protein